MYAELGLRDEAAAEVAALTADRLAAVPRDALWHGSLSYLADACCAVGDRGRRRRRCTTSSSGGGASSSRSATCWPPTAPSTATSAAGRRCSATSGRPRSTSRPRCGSTSRRACRCGSPTASWSTGGSWPAQARAADVERAVALLAAASVTAERLGMATVAAAARSRSAPCAADPVASTGPAVAGLTESRGRRAGADRRGPQQPGDRAAPAHQPAHGGQPRAVDPDEDGSAPTGRRRRRGRCTAGMLGRRSGAGGQHLRVAADRPARSRRRGCRCGGPPRGSPPRCRPRRGSTSCACRRSGTSTPSGRRRRR